MDYYVSTLGSDSNPGTEAQPFLTPNKARSVAKSGDKILFHANHTFHQTLDIGQGMWVTSYGEGRAVFQGVGVRCTSGNGGVTVENLEVRGASGDGITFVRNGWFQDMTIRNCNVFDSGNVGIIIYGCDGYLIEDCEVARSYNGNLYIYGSNYPIKNGVIRRCESYDAIQNDGIAIHEGDNNESCGANHLIENCTCWGNKEEGFDMSDGTDITIRNCNAYGDSYAGIIIEADRVTVDGCDFQSSHHGIHLGDSIGTVIKNTTVKNNTSQQIFTEPYTSKGVQNPTISGCDIERLAWNGNVSGITIVNNNFNGDGNELVYFYGMNASAVVSKMDNNNYYNPTREDVLRDNTGRYTLEGWRSAKGFDLNSTWGGEPNMAHTISINIMVEAINPTVDFNLIVDNNTKTVTQGESVDFTFTLEPIGGWDGSVDMSVSGLEGGSTAFFDPNILGVGMASVLTVNIPVSVPVGGYTLDVTATEI